MVAEHRPPARMDKEPESKTTPPSAFIGIDVSKSLLVVAVHQSDYRFRCANEESAFGKLIAHLVELDPALIVIEATGGLELPVAATLHAAGLPVLLIGARRVRAFAKGSTRLADTNRIHADVLADFAAAFKTEGPPKSRTAPELSALLARRAQLLGMLAAEKQRRASAPPFTLRQELTAHIYSLEKRVVSIDSQLKEALHSSGVWRANSDRLQSVPGILLMVSLCLVVAGILIIPLWIVEYPPLLDYPNHLARAFVLAHLNDPQFHFSGFYAADWGPYPYLTMDLVLVGLQRVFSVFTAGRILLSLCVLSIPIGAWFLIHKANRGNELLVCWSLLASYNLFFLWGFLNFQISMALVLVVLGLWLRYLARPSLARWSLLLLAVTGLYFTHLLGFGLAGLLVTAYSVLTQRRIRQLLLAWLLFLPGAGLHLLFRVRTIESWHFEFRPLAEKWDRLSVLMEGYSPRLDQITLVVLAGCCVAAWWRNREFRWNHPWPALVAGLFGLYWVFPEGYGFGSDADIRLLPLAFLFLPLVAQVGRRGRWLALVVLALFLSRSVNITQTFIAEQRDLASLAHAFSQTPLDARVLPIVESKDDDPQHRPYAHFWAYGVIERGWFSPYLFTEKGVLPLEIKLDTTSPDGFWDLEYKEAPDWDDIADDYDYVWAYHVPRFSQPLEGIADLVYQNGDLQLYRVNRSDDDSGTRQYPGEKPTVQLRRTRDRNFRTGHDAKTRLQSAQARVGVNQVSVVHRLFIGLLR